LSGSAFTWFISLPPNLVISWVDLEKQFHKYFFSRVHEKKLTDLVRLRQRNDESVESFVQRLRDLKNKCYNLVLDDWQLANLAFQGLLLLMQKLICKHEGLIPDSNVKACQPI